MLYAIVGKDVPGSLTKRLAVRSEHVARLQALQDKGSLILAGPFPVADAFDSGASGFSGSLIVAEFDTLSDAEAWAQADPYTTTGVYEEVIIKPFRRTFPT